MYIKHMGHKLNFCTVYSVAQMHCFVKRVANLYLNISGIFW